MFIKERPNCTQGTSCTVSKAWLKMGEAALHRMIFDVYLYLQKDPSLPCYIQQ